MTEMTTAFKYATLLAFCIPLVLSNGCKKAAADSSDTATLVTVQAEKPEIGEIAEQIAADATLSPLAQASISPKITAPVHHFYVQRGAHVKKGQLLAILENRDLAATALDSQGQFEAAQATYETQTKAQVPEDFAKAQLDVSQAKAQVNLAGEIAAARKTLFIEGAIPGRDYDTAAAALVQARATFDVAINHLRSLQKVSRQSALNQAKGQLTSAKGKYLNAEAQVSYSKIQSPIDGVVTDRPLFPGETAASGSTLITVMDTSSLLAKVHLSQIVAQHLTLGDKARVTIPGVDGQVEATVALVSPALDPGSTTVEVWLKADNRAGTYKVGTPVRASITGRAVPKAMKIPLTAILSSQEAGKYVMVAGPDGAAHRKTVTLGINDGTDVQVLTGIAPNDAVITTGGYGLDEGTKVKVGVAEGDAK